MTPPAESPSPDSTAHAETGGNGPAAHIAYLTDRYPALAQADIEREVRGLGRLGTPIASFSLCPPDNADLLAASDREAAAQTTVLSGVAPDVCWHAVRGMLAHPFGLLRVTARVLRTGQPGMRARLLRVRSLAAAVLLVYYMRQRGLRHVHVHVADRAADVGALAAALGQACFAREGRWRWSLTVHAAAELRDRAPDELTTLLQSAAFVSCVSDSCRTALVGSLPADNRSKLSVVHMGVEADRYAAAGAVRAARESASLRVLFVGRLAAEKGPDLLLDAVSQLKASTPELDLDVVVIGHGPLRDHLEVRAGLLGIGPQVRVLGAVAQDGLVEWYRWADVFCLPSLTDGPAVALMEAMATELPVITTAVPGASELVTDGEQGRLIPANRADLIAAALSESAERATRLRWGAACRPVVLTRYLSADAALAMRALFTAATADSSRAPSGTAAGAGAHGGAIDRSTSLSRLPAMATWSGRHSRAALYGRRRRSG